MSEKETGFDLFKSDISNGLKRLRKTIGKDAAVSGSIGFKGEFNFALKGTAAGENLNPASGVSREVNVNAQPQKSALIVGLEKAQKNVDNKISAELSLEQELCKQYSLPSRDEMGAIDLDPEDIRLMEMYKL